MTWTGILWAGFIATTLAASVAWVFRSFNWTLFSPTSQLGCIFFPNPKLPLTEIVGFLLLLLLGSLVFAGVYWLLFGLTGGVSWWRGVLLGGVHGLLTAAALPLLGKVSTCVREGYLPPPGNFGFAWGRATPVSLVVGHAVYGGVLGAILAAF